MADVTGGTAPTNASPFAVPADIQAVYDHFGDTAQYQVATAASLPGSDNWVGRMLYVVDDHTVRVCTTLPGTWEIVGGGPNTTTITPTAGAGFSVSDNELYKKGGRLLGSIEWTRATGTLTHADVIMTLPAGSRPSHEYVVPMTAAPASTQIGFVVCTVAGQLQALSPITGRTSGTLLFDMPL